MSAHGNAVDGASFEDAIREFEPKCLKGHVWSPGKFPCKDFVPLTMKDDFGIALSGGGLRAACLGLGWLRALNRENLLTKARYISVNSGGSWVTEPLLWYASKECQRLDENLTTSELDASLQKILDETLQKRMRKALCDNFSGDLVKNLISNIGISSHKQNAWSESVASIFEAVCGEKHGSYLCIEEVPRLSYRLPFLIVNGSVVVADSEDKIHVAPFEFTPTYCGIPLNPKEAIHDSFGNSGGLVHRTVFGVNYAKENRDKVVQRMDNTSVVEVYETKENTAFKLSDISSISSSAVVEGYYEQYYYTLRGKGQHFIDSNFPLKNHYWAYNAEHNKDQQLSGGKVIFADGGSTDNTGILALLRRDVKNIFALCAILADITQDEEVLVEELYDYMALFGKVTSRVKCIKDWESYNNQRWVFDSALWEVLQTALREKHQKGEPLIHTFENIKVRANPHCGVIGGTSITITFVFNGRCTKFPGVDWDELTPSIWSKYISPYLNPMSMFYPHTTGSDFPLISTEYLHFSPELVKSLADIADWSLTYDDFLTKFSRDL